MLFLNSEHKPSLASGRQVSIIVASSKQSPVKSLSSMPPSALWSSVASSYPSSTRNTPLPFTDLMCLMLYHRHGRKDQTSSLPLTLLLRSCSSRTIFLSCNIFPSAHWRQSSQENIVFPIPELPSTKMCRAIDWPPCSNG